MLAEYFEKNRILLNFKAKDFKKALEKMLIVSSEKKHSQIIDTIIKRESLMPTVLGKGVALPRVIIANKEKTEIIIAISQKGINFKGFDLLPVKIIFLYLFSKKDDYPSILAQSLRLLNEDSLRAELLNSKTREEIIAAIKAWEEE
ncbi:PTS sugar transporter subunit IIA [candidate division WOR-3 bacterium]|nr:PTS sugar transporter subunit IIA [candidate division WOR-3 bacterium]